MSDSGDQTRAGQHQAGHANGSRAISMNPHIGPRMLRIAVCEQRHNRRNRCVRTQPWLERGHAAFGEPALS